MKKKILAVLIGLLVLGVVSAGVVKYFGTKETEIITEQAITMENCNEVGLEAAGGELITTGQCIATSQTSVDIPIEIVTTGNDTGILSLEPQYDFSVDAIPYDTTNGYVGANFEAGRSYITIRTDMTLSELDTIEFIQNVLSGYAGSVNILLDINNDGEFESKKDLTTGYLTDGADDVLKVEYAKVKTPYDNSADYPSGVINTFGDKGIINDAAEMWLYSGMPGAVGDIGYNYGTLADWKVGKTRGTTCYYIDVAPWTEETCEDITINGDTEIYGIQIETLGWISASESKVKEIKINGVPQNIVTIGAEQDLVFDLVVEFASGAVGTYDLITNIEVQ